ncbi:MAG: glycosyltransferase family 39 protein [Anaerolineales bacterium]|jgi:4-amino-4-deoxy-L-arabinose transferase-like glycosyltransferase
MKIKIRRILAIAFFLWLGSLLTVFYGVQKPAFLQVASGLGATAGTVLVTLVVLADAAGLGSWIIERLRLLELQAGERLVLGSGLGLALFGLAGFGLALIDLAKPVVLLVLLGGLLVWLIWRGQLRTRREDLKELIRDWKETILATPVWVRAAIALAILLTFLLALAPPVEAFDALLYHLTVPALWLRDGGLRLVDIPHYWFPSLIEGIFVWPMALGSDTAPQLVHFSFGLLTALLLWDWARRLWGHRVARWTLALLLTMPSLLWLAAWAYTDLALSFFALAVLYTVWKWKETSDPGWLFLGGAMAGFAMGVKYTSFPVPLTGVLLILVWGRRTRAGLLGVLQFSGLALLVALPWYLRNYLWTGNPVYPFFFGGPFWDAFRERMYAGTGTGIGWNLGELLLLPLTVTLGYRDQNYYDGRIGPFFVILIPVALWTLWRARRESSSRQHALLAVTSFAALNSIVWVIGVVQTDHLWQSRLLFPGLLPIVLVMAIGVETLEQLDTPVLKISFVVSVLMGLMVSATLLDFGLQVAYRNPILVAVGAETRQSYMARIQPGYAGALELVGQTPADAYIYFLYEPRSYGMPRRVQPDPINDNLLHSLYVYGNSDAAVAAWRAQGYTHILIYRPWLDIDLKAQPQLPAQLEQVMNSLRLMGRTASGDYELYQILPP